MEEYSHLEIYKETIHFMNIAFPEWTTNKGIGFWAAEFILTSILNLEHIYEEASYSSFDILKDLYTNLVVDYKSTTKQFTSAVIDAIIYNFEIEYDELLDENEHLSKEDYKVFYNNLYNSFEKRHLNKITYIFLDMEFPVI